MNRVLADEAESIRVGEALGRALDRQSAFVTLTGDLGAGKTTLVRAALRSLGHTGPVRSPTYSLIETYVVSSGAVHHLDWYRLGDDSELEALGFRDLLGPGQSVLVEWPERMPWVAQRADVALTLAYLGDGRQLSAQALTPVGDAVLAAWMTEIG